MNEIYDDDVDPFEGVEEDVYQFVFRANTADVQTGTDASRTQSPSGLSDLRPCSPWP